MANNQRHSIFFPGLNELRALAAPSDSIDISFLSYRYFELFFLNLKHKFSSIKSGG